MEFKSYLLESTVTQQQLKDLEKFADRVLEKFDVDIEFTKHFAERMSDDRNNPSITIAELQKFFKTIERDKASKIKNHGEGQAVLKKIQNDLNIPVVIDLDKSGEFVVTMKTIMRKKNFMTSNDKITYE